MFDSVTLAAVADELNEKIVRGRVQEIVQLDALSFGMEIYSQHRRHYLFLTAHPEDARVHLVSGKLRGSGEAPAPLVLLLRKYVENAFLDSVVQPPHERVLRMTFDHAAEGVTNLVIETIGRYSNLILVDAGDQIVDALKRIGPQLNRARVILPKHPYVPPPPQSKIDPSLLTAASLARVLEENRGQPLWQVLVKSVAGVSPLLAHEIAFRIENEALGGRREQDGTIQAQTAVAVPVLRTLLQLSHAPWRPTVAFEEADEPGETESRAPADYAPFLITQCPVVQEFDSISAAIEAFYGAVESYAAAKEPLRGALEQARDRLARKRDALAQSLPEAEQVEGLKTKGELVLAYASQVRAGQKSLAAETETGSVEIELNPKLSAIENAQAYFKEYHRAKDALSRVPPLLAAAQAEVDYADQMLSDLELAENRAEMDAVITAAREARLLPGMSSRGKRGAKGAPGGPRTVPSSEGFTILVGRNAQQNEEITFQRAEPEDPWLHARNVPGAHVVVLSGGRDVPEPIIQQAAELAAFYSQARSESYADVMVTPRKNVRHLRGGRPGMVTVRSERVLRVSPRSEQDKK